MLHLVVCPSADDGTAVVGHFIKSIQDDDTVTTLELFFEPTAGGAEVIALGKLGNALENEIDEGWGSGGLNEGIDLAKQEKDREQESGLVNGVDLVGVTEGEIAREGSFAVARFSDDGKETIGKGAVGGLVAGKQIPNGTGAIGRKVTTWVSIEFERNVNFFEDKARKQVAKAFDGDFVALDLQGFEIFLLKAGSFNTSFVDLFSHVVQSFINQSLNFRGDFVEDFNGNP
jgi:hypothetical protein